MGLFVFVSNGSIISGNITNYSRHDTRCVDMMFDSVHEQVKLRFDAEGLNIPYPQCDVHAHEVKQAA